MTIDRNHDVVASVADLVERRYVFADVAAELAATLRAGTFDASSEEELAAQVTQALQSSNGDRHLRLLWHAAPIVDLADPAEAAAEHLRHAERSSYGVTGPDWLDDDVAVLTFEPLLFHPAVGGDALAAAMQSVSDARGLVLDVRSCLGGAPSAVCLVLTYLLGPELHLTDMIGRDPADLHQLWTLPWVPGTSVAPDVPVAVLTSSATFSGAEDLAYTLQAHGRAVVVGGTTGGGAHPREGFRVSDHLEATIPVARAVNRITGGNWEGVGVTPDVACPASEALVTAQARVTRSR
ncbi:MAG: S41 family peptidase [Aeromicrobium sp.]